MKPRTSGAGSAALVSASPGAKSTYLAIGGLALIALIWGYNWVVMKIGLRYASPFSFAALRMFLGTLFLFVVLAILRHPLRPRALVLTAVIGLLQTSPAVLVFWALESGGAGRIAILSYTMPFWLLLMAWVVLGEGLKRLQWLAVILALTGLILVLAPWHLRGVFSALLALAGAVCWAASALMAKVLHRQHKVDLLSLTAWQMLLGSLPLVLVALLVWSEPPVWSGSFVAALAYNIFPATALALFLWFFALQSLDAGTTGLLVLAVPVVGVASAWIQLGERPDVGEALGTAAIVGALALVGLREIVVKRSQRSSA